MSPYYTHRFLSLFECWTKVRYTSDVAHPQTLDRSELMDLILILDFHFSYGGARRAVIPRQFAYIKR